MMMMTTNMLAREKENETTVSMLHSYRDDDDDDDMDDAAPNIVKPTPQPDKKRSLFTRRQHRTLMNSLLTHYTNKTIHNLADFSKHIKPSCQEPQVKQAR